MKFLGNCVDSIPVTYYPAEISNNPDDPSGYAWECGVQIGSGTLLYDEMENVYNFVGEIADDAAIELLPYLTIRCICGPVHIDDDIDIVEDISKLGVYISQDSAFCNTPNIEVINE